MSLRDWLAGQASEEDISEHRRNWPHGTSQPTREEAKYLYADAMLAARSQAGGTSK
jgi:hypothetical protein